MEDPEEQDDEVPLAVQYEEIVETYPQEQSTPRRPENDDASVGVTVITGYLGAGKSTVKLSSCSGFSFFFLNIWSQYGNNDALVNGFALSW